MVKVTISFTFASNELDQIFLSIDLMSSYTKDTENVFQLSNHDH